MIKKAKNKGHVLSKAGQHVAGGLKMTTQHHYTRKCLYTSSGKSKDKLSKVQGDSNE